MKVTKDDIGRKVIYKPKNEEGRITSFNDRFVFVDYSNSGRGQATKREDLKFLTEKTETA